MARFVESQTPDLFRGLSYGGYHANTLQALEAQQSNGFTDRLTAAGSKFLQASADLIAMVDFEKTARITRAAARMAGSLWQDRVVRELTTIGEFQQAPAVMRPLIMASPQIRKMYHSGRLEGYGEHYVDNQPGVIGEQHYDYQRVMNGLFVETEDGFTCTNWIDVIAPEDELYVDQQHCVLNTWANIWASIQKNNDDPTSRWNASL